MKKGSGQEALNYGRKTGRRSSLKDPVLNKRRDTLRQHACKLFRLADLFSATQHRPAQVGLLV